MAFVICEPCVDVKDTACVQVCPVDCIYDFDGERQLYIHPTECIDCAACQPECPVQAIFPEAEVPSQWHVYIERNRSIFETRSLEAPAAASGRPAAGTDGVAAPASGRETEAIRALLLDVQAKRTSPAEGVERLRPLLDALGVRVT
jgi:NAD-dependent dihydropyrimidine dehydrogenase PreA subunit